MGGLSAKDLTIEERLREAGVLEPLDGNRLDQRKGVILVPCGDGRRFNDIFRHHRKVARSQRRNPLVHVLSLNGGALNIAEGSPLPEAERKGFSLMVDIAGARELMGISTVALYAHAPCGAATKLTDPPLDIEEVVALLMKAKTRVKSIGDGITVSCFMHVERMIRGRPHRRTWHVSRDAWTAWADANR